MLKITPKENYIIVSGIENISAISQQWAEIQCAAQKADSSVIVFMPESMCVLYNDASIEFIRNMPYITVMAAESLNGQTPQLLRAFDIRLATEEYTSGGNPYYDQKIIRRLDGRLETVMDTYLTEILKGKTEYQIHAIASCFIKARKHGMEAALYEESRQLYQMIKQKVPERKTAKKLIDLRLESDVLHVIFQAPDNNRMTGEFAGEYEETMHIVESMAEHHMMKGIIISSKGRHFSTGADIDSLVERSGKELARMKSDTDFTESHRTQKHSVTFLYDLDIPVISAVSGFCIGSGCEIAINSHARVCDKSARIGLNESTFGILPVLGGIARTVDTIGFTDAFEMVMAGGLISAQQAHEIGWADFVTEKKKALPLAEKLIHYIIEQSEGIYSRRWIKQYMADFAKETVNE